MEDERGGEDGDGLEEVGENGGRCRRRGKWKTK